MRVGLHADQARCETVTQCVQGISIVRLDSMMLAEEIAVAAEDTAAVGRVVLDSVWRRARKEAAERLRRDLVPRNLVLRKSGERR